jgi:glycosyltransferase involved in cell wall biosynthesis
MKKLIRITTAPISLKYLLWNQMRFMRENGFDVLMVSSEGKEWEDIIVNEQCRHVIVPMTRKITPFRDLISLWRLYRLFRKERPDIVHSHTPKAGLLAMIAAWAAGVHIRVHTVAGLRYMTATGFKRWILVQMERLTARAARYVWPNSHSLLDHIKHHRLCDPSKLEVIGRGSSNGVDLDRFSPEVLDPAMLDTIKKQVGYDKQYRYILNMGRIVRDKGVEEVLRSFQAVHASDNSLRLIVLGAFEDDLDPISDEARSILQTHPAIIHIDWSDRVEYFMHLSDLLLHASYREGFPNTLLQAGAMHCPIVCTAIEGSIDIVEDRSTGLLFPARDAAALESALRYALARPDEMRTYADRLREKIASQFSQPYLYGCLKDRYLQLLAQHATV